MTSNKITRRTFAASSTATFAGCIVLTEATQAATSTGPFQAMGTRVGEMTDSSAIIWTRITQHATRNNRGVEIQPLGKAKEKSVTLPVAPVEQLEGACPGANGRIQVRYGMREDLSDAKTTAAQMATEANDFISEFKLTGLTPGTVYHYMSEIIGSDGPVTETAVRGKFETSPAPNVSSNLRFCVMTCQGYHDRGHAEGHSIYPAMLALNPQFTCLTGDLVYYDNDAPRAVTPQLACYHWERMFSLPRLVEFTRNVGCYWLKDDHDTLNNDSWPSKTMGEFTFAEGQQIFRQQAPMPEDGPSYRTFRWGRDLQVWFTEGRDFRSPNTMPDGPGKTIWGEEQKAWFKRTVQESDATWKVLVSPTPLVGPDRASGKNDNHSNAGFAHEGNEIRRWIQAHALDNFFVVCGDRHWQYHSVHTETGLNEFSVGAASDEHAGGSPGLNSAVHKFHRVKGGFLSITLKHEDRQSAILFELRDVQGRVVYSWSKQHTV